MQLLSVQLARTTWLMDVAEINTRGKNIFLDLVPALTDAYKFKTYPSVGGDFKDGMKFTLGTFTNSKGDQIQVGLTVWTDGVAADTYSSTSDSDEFLEDVVQHLPEWGYGYDPGMVRRKMHLSQVFVRCSKRLAGLNSNLRDFATRLSDAADGIAFDCAAIEFWPDQTSTLKPANFSFQKRTGDAFTEDRYWSQAGFSTGAHLDLLDAFEAILS